jgi:hypothetical protein
MLLFIIFVILFVITFIISSSKESFSGVSSDNPFTDLTCIKDNSGMEHIVKISPSLNIKTPTGIPYITIHKLFNPTKNAFVEKSDFVNDNDTIECDDSKFSKYYVKSIRDENSKSRKLFNNINNRMSTTNSTWKTQECTPNDINNNNHWCYKVFHAINDNPDVCESKIGKVTPRYCSIFNDATNGIAKYTQIQSTNTPIINNLTQQGKGCILNTLSQYGSTPQSYTNSDGDYVCLKDRGIEPKNAECYSSQTKLIYNPVQNGDKLKCNPGDIIRGKKGSDPCMGNGLFDTVNTNPGILFGTIPTTYSNVSQYCNSDGTIKAGMKLPAKKVCIREPTIDEITALQNSYKFGQPIPNQNTPWYSGITNAFQSCAV